jgi:hypothetical protein
VEVEVEAHLVKPEQGAVEQAVCVMDLQCL